MEEQKNEIKETEQKTESENTEQKPEITTRSMILWALGGVYLLYTGYRLCKSVLDGAEDSGWGFFAAGVFFIVVGVVLLCLSIKSYNAKVKREQAESAAEEAAASGEQKTDNAGNTEPASEASGEVSQQKSDNNPGSQSANTPKKPMSIAERARLASTLGDVEESEEEAEEE